MLFKDELTQDLFYFTANNTLELITNLSSADIQTQSFDLKIIKEIYPVCDDIVLGY